MGAAIAPWFRLRLPSCGPRFESQAHHLCFFQFVLLKLLLELGKNENKQKEAGIGPYLKNNNNKNKKSMRCCSVEGGKKFPPGWTANGTRDREAINFGH